MNKTVLTLFIIAGVLLTSSLAGMALTRPDDNFQRVQNQNSENFQSRTNENETTTKQGIQRQDNEKVKQRSENNQEHIISVFSEISGMTEKEIEDYISQDGNNLRSLAEEKGLTDAFINKLKEDR